MMVEVILLTEEEEEEECDDLEVSTSHLWPLASYLTTTISVTTAAEPI